VRAYSHARSLQALLSRTASSESSYHPDTPSPSDSSAADPHEPGGWARGRVKADPHEPGGWARGRVKADPHEPGGWARVRVRVRVEVRGKPKPEH